MKADLRAWRGCSFDGGALRSRAIPLASNPGARPLGCQSEATWRMLPASQDASRPVGRSAHFTAVVYMRYA
jgi:hypothetical protein